jgi:hypothetical protein
MSFLFTLEDDKLQEQLPELFIEYEQYVIESDKLFDIEGKKLEHLARDLPKHQAFYAQKMQEMKQLMKWLENNRNRLEARFTKNYSQGSRALAAREATTLINGEKDIVELNQLIIEAALIYGKLEEIVDGFKQMGWMIGAIVKLRVATIEDAII